MKDTVFLNGKFLSAKLARLSALSPGFLYGWGLFETMRSYDNEIVYFDQHLKRIKESSRLIGMRFNYSSVQLKEIVRKLVKINCFKDSYVRLSLWKTDSGADILVLVKKYRPYPSNDYKKGFRACICRYRQNEFSDLARHKTANYLSYQLAYLEAKGRGFDEAILLNNRGFIAEASRSNIFFAKDKVMFTPALDCGCLNGITRKVIFALARKYHIKIYEGNYTLQDLYAADEAFLTNSLMGVMPLPYIEKQRIAKGRVGPIAGYFIKKYNFLLKNGT
jgi:branched-subunit amino acid aminotransferase/4-amino-4-deoxychorismate lyase